MLMGAPIVSTVSLGSPHLEQLAAWELRTVDLTTIAPVDLARTLRDAEGLLVDSHATADAELIDLAPELRVISTVSVGFDHIDVAAAASRGITVTHTPVLSDAVADLTMGLIIMTARRLREATSIVAGGGWDDALLGSDLKGKTLLVVGLGRIGREVARRALGFKLHVCGYDARADTAPVDGVERIATLAEGLARADIVSLHVDLNDSTRHLLDDAAFAAMKPTAFVINTSRGGVVDQVALTRALAERRIAGAGLDVLEVEPPGAAEPLLAMPNVVVLPHIGSATVETRRAMLDCAVLNLVTCMRGEACECALDLDYTGSTTPSTRNTG